MLSFRIESFNNSKFQKWTGNENYMLLDEFSLNLNLKFFLCILRKNKAIWYFPSTWYSIFVEIQFFPEYVVQGVCCSELCWMFHLFHRVCVRVYVMFFNIPQFYFILTQAFWYLIKLLMNYIHMVFFTMNFIIIIFFFILTLKTCSTLIRLNMLF